MRTAGQGPGGFEKRDGFIKPGQDLVVAGYAGMAGARLIFQKKKEKIPPKPLRGNFKKLV